MRNKSVYSLRVAIILLAGLLTSAARAQQTGTPANPTRTPPSAAGAETGSSVVAGSPEKVVIKVGPSQITQAEIDFLVSTLNPQVQQSLAIQGRRTLGEEYVKILLLSQQAAMDRLDASPVIRQRLQMERTQMLAEAEYQKMASEVKVSPEEVTQYYTSHQPDFETAQVRQFVIRKKPEGAKDATPGLTPEEARAKAEAIRKALAAGTDIKKVMQDFAVPNVVMIEPEPRTVQRGKMLPALDKAAFELKDGAISEPVDVPQALVFLQIVGHGHPQQTEVATEIEGRLRQQKLDAALTELRKKSDVWFDEDYFKGPVASAPTLGPRPSASSSPPTPKR